MFLTSLGGTRGSFRMTGMQVRWRVSGSTPLFQLPQFYHATLKHIPYVLNLNLLFILFYVQRGSINAH